MTKRPVEASDWSDASAALLHSTLEYEPTEADCERVRRALAQRLHEQSGASAPSSDAIDLGVRRAALGKLMLIGIGVACLVSSAVVLMRSEREGMGGPPLLAAAAQPPAHKRAASDEPVPNDIPVLQDSAADSRERAVESSARAEASPLPKKARRPKLTAVPIERASPAEPTTSSAASQMARAAGETLARPSEAAERMQPNSAIGRASPTPSAATRAVVDPPEATATQETTSDARAELVWLGKTNNALRESKWSAVLALCAQHVRHWSHGMFVQEREALAAIAACRAAAQDAAARAARFLRSYPHAPLRPRVEEACAAHKQEGSDVAR